MYNLHEVYRIKLKPDLSMMTFGPGSRF